MKIKNISYIEQHIEKFILAVAVICALWILYAYVFSNPYVLKSGARQLTPDDIENALKTASLDLNNDLKTNSDPVPKINPPNYTTHFLTLATESPPSPRPNLTYYWGDPGLDPLVFGTIISDDFGIRNFVVPNVPPPTNVVAHSDFAQLSKILDAKTLTELTSKTGATGPGDFFYVTISGTFSFDAWLQANIQNVPELSRIKQDWLKNALIITQVQLTRCDWEDAKQEWSPPHKIDMLPGNPDYTNPPAPRSESDLQNLLREIRLNRSPITHPPFLPVDPARPWGLVSPAQTAARIKQLNTQTSEARRRLNAITRDSAGKPITLSGPALKESTDLQTTIASLKKEADKVNADAGLDPDTPPETSRVWAHDINVTPGRKYRYQLNVGIQNPLFGKGTFLTIPLRLMFANKLTLTSSTIGFNDNWVEVTIPQNNHLFILSAQKQDRSIDVECWRVFNGQWLRHTFHTQPGDTIGQLVEATADGKTYPLDFRTGQTLVDIDFKPQPGSADPIGHALLTDASNRLLQIPALNPKLQDPLRQQLLQELDQPPTPTTKQKPR